MKVKSRLVVTRGWVLVERSAINRNPDSIWEERSGPFSSELWQSIAGYSFVKNPYNYTSRRVNVAVNYILKINNMSSKGDSRRNTD